MKHFHRILAATDLTKTSTPAVHEAIEMAKEYEAELLIAHAYQPPEVIEAQPVDYDRWDRNARAQVEANLKLLVAEAKKQGVDARPLVLNGAPYEAIVDAAKKNKADLVIMGTHGRTGAARFFLGSVTARVIPTVPCPVMTVHAA